MGKKIIAIHGSPRKHGNSIYLAKQALKELEDKKYSVEEIFLHDLKIRPCKGCDACRKVIKGHCVIKDDMQKIYKQVLSTDLLLLSSPIYWFTISAQLKLFFDRLYAVHNDSFSALKGLKIGIVLTYGDSDPIASGSVNAIRTIQDIASYTQAEIIGMVYGTASVLGDAKRDKKLVAKARALGKALAHAKTK